MNASGKAAEHRLVTRAAANNDIARSVAPSAPGQSSSVLCFVRGDEGYGVSRVTFAMADNFTARGIAVRFVAVRAGPFAAEIARRGYPIENLGLDIPDLDLHGWAYLTRLLRALRLSIIESAALCQSIQRWRPQWVHIGHNLLLISAALAGWRTSTPVYWHLPGYLNSKLLFGLQRPAYRLICRAFRVHALPNSKYTASLLGDARATQRILYPGTDVARFSPTAEFKRVRREDLRLDSASPVFLISARLTPHKAQDRVVEAVIRLLGTGTGLSLLIVGGPTESAYCDQLKARISEAKAEGWIRILGPVADPRPYYELADVVINSRTGAEPFGLSVVEAMLMERPVLAYALGGPSETVLDGATGWLLHDPSAQGWVQGLQRALADRERWQSMGQRARTRAIERFSLEHMCETYLDFVAEDLKTPLAR
jgi:glycosyltransferase involved in cell wall biosynthesis